MKRILGPQAAVLATLLAQLANADCPVTPFNYPLGRSTAFYKPAIPDRAKDFAIVYKDGLYHAIYIRNRRDLPALGTGNEVDFGHATSADFYNWTQLNNLNPDGGYDQSGNPIHFTWDASHVWAPHIILVGTTYYMFFTGVDASGNQSTGVTTSTDLSNWTPHSANPVYSITPTTVPWAKQTVPRAMRDVFVMRDVSSRDGSGVNGWLMYFTTQLASTGQETIGMAWASFSDLFTWHDLGDIASTRTGHSESSHIIQHNGTYYLFLSVALSDAGIEYFTSTDPVATTWSGPVKLNDTSQAGGFQQLWFASETISTGVGDYFVFIHDYDPPVTGDPICDPTRTPSTIETKGLTWLSPGPGFTLKDDVVLPSAITNAGAGAGKTTLAFSWSAPGDEGTVGTVDHYDVRRSYSPITEVNWFSAFQEFNVSPPMPYGSSQCASIQFLDPCTNYYLAVRGVDEAGNYGPISNPVLKKTRCTGSIEVFCADKPVMNDADEGQPDRLELTADPSNQSHGRVRVQYGIPAALAAGTYELAVFDVAGRRIASLAGGQATPGRQSAAWDLSAQSGRRVSNGIYLVRLRVGDQTIAKRIVVAR